MSLSGLTLRRRMLRHGMDTKFDVSDSPDIEPLTPLVRISSLTQPMACWFATSRLLRCVLLQSWLYSLQKGRPSPGCFIQCHTEWMPSVVAWGCTGYHTRSHLPQIPETLNNQRNVLEPEVLMLIQRIPEAAFQQYNAHAHVALSLNAQAFFRTRYFRLHPCLSYSPNMLLIEHVWDYIDQRIVHTGR